MVLARQLEKVQKHFDALREYKQYIEQTGFDFSRENFEAMETPDKAVLEAYLKRFSSLQDYLGAKVFGSLLDAAGISYTKMSEVLTIIEKEGIIDLDTWIAFRNVRNNLEHDYPDELEEALADLHYCIDSFSYMQHVVNKVFAFAEQYDARA